MVKPCYIVAEIGINHNGDIEIAKQLIDMAVSAGCDAVKFQKRTPEICVPADQRGIMRETPWGYISYMDYRRRVEFGQIEYEEIQRHCAGRIEWSASCWDIPSVDFMEDFDIDFHKIPSACITDLELLRRVSRSYLPGFISTGASTLEQISTALRNFVLAKITLLHSCSAYPAKYCELNLSVIPRMRDYFGLPVGYSGHETGIATTIAAVALGATVIERHITLDRTMWGSDQAASLGPRGLQQLVRDIRIVERSIGDGVKRVLPSEQAAMKKLRRFP